MPGRNLLVVGLIFLLLPWGPVSAEVPKSESRQRLSNKPWQGVAALPVTAREIDRLVAERSSANQAGSSPVVDDERFLRRVTLDLTGRLPSLEELAEFVKDKDPHKRSRKIDQLLNSDHYARHWANYWREVFAIRVTDNARRALVLSFQKWLESQFAANRPWNEMTRELLTAKGMIRLPRLGLAGGSSEGEDQGATFFLLSYGGNDAIYDRTNEAARIFLGVQIQCAQCHDHPYDGWKREQYHELAAFLGKLADRPVFERTDDRLRLIGFQLVSRPFGDHRMPDMEDPKKSYPVSLRFLDGASYVTRSGDQQRREFLAAKITENNYYFAAAFVNRMWGELMGRAIVEPVDDLGPTREGIDSPLLVRLAASFHASSYDIKALLRTICQTEAYQRSVVGEPSGPGVQASLGVSPKRLSADALWECVTDLLGSITRFNFGRSSPRFMTMMAGGGRLAAGFGAELKFKQDFRFDPSLPADEIETTIPQVLWLMNNPGWQARVRADGPTMLGRLLTRHPRDVDAVTELYQRVLGRRPSEREMTKVLNYIRQVNHRREAFEDLLWALMNSTEFLMKR